jgi:hypothetical protein
MSERMKRIIEKMKEAASFSYPTPEIFEGLGILASEVDALMRGFDRMENLVRGCSTSIHATPPKAQERCDICSIPFAPNDTKIGHGDGAGQRFAHDWCYWEERAHKAVALANAVREFVRDSQVQGLLAYGHYGNELDALTRALAKFEKGE